MSGPRHFRMVGWTGIVGGRQEQNLAHAVHAHADGALKGAEALKGAGLAGSFQAFVEAFQKGLWHCRAYHPFRDRVQLRFILLLRLRAEFRRQVSQTITPFNPSDVTLADHEPTLGETGDGWFP